MCFPASLQLFNLATFCQSANLTMSSLHEITGRGYAFVGYGARTTVDACDAPSLMRTPYLQRVLR